MVYEYNMFQNILIATDDSQLIKNAIEYTANCFPDADYHIISVINTSTPSIPITDILMENMRESSRRAIQDGVEILKNMGIEDCKKIIRKGAPSEEIVKYSEDYNIDLIVMGTQSKTGTQIYEIGETCLHVLEHSSIPVLLFDYIVDIKKPKKLLHPTSGTEYSLKAGRIAIKLAEYFDGDVNILSTRGGSETVFTFKKLHEFSEEHNIPYHLRSCAVKPHKEIVNESKKHDLIVASLGRPGLKYKLRKIYPPFAIGKLEREVIVETRNPTLIVED